MGDPPIGTVTFLFTDVEGSTALLLELGAGGYAEELRRHRRLLREAVDEHGGVEVDTQGDAFFIAFASAREAVAAALQAQHAFADGPVRVRMGLHTGEALFTGEGYVGVDVHRAARIAAVAHGGQVLLSRSTTELLEADVPLRDLGVHRLKDLSAPERLYQLGEREFPPLRSLTQTNLPAQPSPLVGRQRELADIVLMVSEVRLVTLTGAGGSGKTRLALQAAVELADRFQSGAVWVPLAAVRDPELVVPAIAQTIGSRASLSDHIGDTHLLLLLDNLEQVLPAAAQLSDLLRTCPNLHLLTTSRAPLRIEGEREYRVDPLTEADAVTLFSERAADAEPFETVRAICRRLEGLPLAIELAAARTRLLPPEELLDRLEHALPILTGGRRDAPERQQTLRATIAWSHDLLDSEEQQLFAHLAVFAGGFTLHAAEEVADARLQTLGSLMEMNLLRREGHRFHMLETIREYAAERLNESSAGTDVHTLHATYFCALAEQASLDDPTRQDQVFWLDRLDAEHDNLGSALDFAVSRGLADLEVRLVMSLRSFWYLRGYWTEGRARVEHALELPVAERPEIRTGLLREAAQLTERQGDFARARALTSQHLALARELGDDSKLAEALMRAGIAAAVQDNFQAAQSHFREVLSLSRRTDDNWFAARAHLNLGYCFAAANDLFQAERELERSIDLARVVANKGLLATCLCGLSFAHLRSGRSDQVRPLLKESLLLSIEIRSPEHIAFALVVLGRVLATAGQPEDGARLLGAALSAYEELASVEILPVFRAFRNETEAILYKRLGAERFNATLDEGAELGILAGGEYALRILHSTPDSS